MHTWRLPSAAAWGANATGVHGQQQRLAFDCPPAGTWQTPRFSPYSCVQPSSTCAPGMRVAAGTRLLIHAGCCVIVPQPLGAHVVQQVLLMLLTANNRGAGGSGYCSTPLLQHSLSQRRMGWVAAALDSVSTLLAAHMPQLSGPGACMLPTESSCGGWARRQHCPTCPPLRLWKAHVL